MWRFLGTDGGGADEGGDDVSSRQHRGRRRRGWGQCRLDTAPREEVSVTETEALGRHPRSRRRAQWRLRRGANPSRRFVVPVGEVCTTGANG